MLGQKHISATGLEGPVSLPPLRPKTRCFSQAKTPSFYYPFGMLSQSYANSSYAYSFAFQGQEKDNEHIGDGNSYAFEYRIHDARLGRFLSVDPLAHEYPWNSTYAFAENQVVWAIDLEGLEKYIIHQRSFAPWPKFGRMIRLLSRKTGLGYVYFNGDNRNFSLSKNASSKVATQFTIDLATNTVTDAKVETGVTRMFDEETNEEIDRDRAVGAVSVTGPVQDGDVTTVKSRISATNPLVPLSSPIVWTGTTTISNNIDKGFIDVTYSYLGKGFPALEAFIEDEAGTRVFLGVYVSPKKEEIFNRLTGTELAVGGKSVGFLRIQTDDKGIFTGNISVFLGFDNDGKEHWFNGTIEQWNNVIESMPAAKDKEPPKKSE